MPNQTETRHTATHSPHTMTRPLLVLWTIGGASRTWKDWVCISMAVWKGKRCKEAHFLTLLTQTDGDVLLAPVKVRKGKVRLFIWEISQTEISESDSYNILEIKEKLGSQMMTGLSYCLTLVKMDSNNRPRCRHCQSQCDPQNSHPLFFWRQEKSTF